MPFFLMLVDSVRIESDTSLQKVSLDLTSAWIMIGTFAKIAGMLIFTTLVQTLFCYIWALSTDWKDDWIRMFEGKALAQQQYCQAVNPNASCFNLAPAFHPARMQSNYHQIVSRIIWQHFYETSHIDGRMKRSMLSFVDHNPEYDYYLFDDSMALDFMCTFYPEVALIYQQVQLEAVRQDLWKLAVLFRYGGAVFDTSVLSVVPLRAIIRPNASVVTSLDQLGQFQHDALIYAPRHPIIKAALKIAVYNLKRLFNNLQGGDVEKLSGVGALHTAVREVFHTHHCSSYDSVALRSRYAPNATLDIPQLAACTHKVGVLQVYNGDLLGQLLRYDGDRTISTDRNATTASLEYRDLFQHVGVYETGLSTLKIGECIIDRTDTKHRWKKSAHAKIE